MSVAALRKAAERGQVKAYRWGRRVRFKRAELDALFTAHQEARKSVGSPPVNVVAGGEIR